MRMATAATTCNSPSIATAGDGRGDDMTGSLNIVSVLQIALGCVLATVVAWRMVRQRPWFPARSRYISRNAGVLLMLADAVLSMAYSLFGYSGHFLTAGAIVACVGVGMFVWGGQGMIRPGAK